MEIQEVKEKIILIAKNELEEQLLDKLHKAVLTRGNGAIDGFIPCYDLARIKSLRFFKV